jgi:hypothetical protein
LKCFKKYWGNCPYELYLSTNTKKYDGITVFNNNKKNDMWTERALPVLRNLKTKYVLIMCDDLFICDTVDDKRIEKILDSMDEYNIKFCRLEVIKKGIRVRNNDDLVWVNKQMPYALNLYMGIYNREFLIEQLGDGTQSAWDIEKKWMEKTYDAPNEYYEDIVSCNKEIIKVIHGITKGKWMPSSLKKLESIDICVESTRDIMKKKDEIIFYLKHIASANLTPQKRYAVKKMLRKFGFEFSTDN